MNGLKHIESIAKRKRGLGKHMGTVDNLFVLHSLITHFLNQKRWKITKWVTIYI